MTDSIAVPRRWLARRLWLLPLGVSVGLWAVGCGMHREERIEKALRAARARLEEVSLILKNARAVLPKRGEVSARGCVGVKGSVVADFRTTTSEPGNLDVMMLADVSHPWKRSLAEHPVAVSSRLAEPMGWSLGGVPVPENLSASFVERMIGRALDIRYVLLFRVVDWKAPRAISIKEFTGGSVQCDFYLVDIETSQIPCELPAVAKSKMSLLYFRPQGKTEGERIADFQTVLEKNLSTALRRDAYNRIETLVKGSRIWSY